MIKHILLAGMGAFALAGCDVAGDIAGDAIEGEVRNAVTAQCRQVAEGAGIVAGRVSEICDCSTDTFLADPDLTMEDVSRERIEGIVRDCAARSDAGNADPIETTPAEETGG